MSVLLRSILTRSRPVFPRVLRLRSPCLTRRLGYPSEVVTLLVRATNSASVSHASTLPSVGTEEMPTATVRAISGIKHEENEQRYYHHFMETHVLYRPTVFTKLDLQLLLCEAPSDITYLVDRNDWSGATNREIVEAFRLMTAFAVKHELLITNPKFDVICSVISKRADDFLDEEMLEIGKLHTLWIFPESIKEKNYKLLNVAFDNYCCTRYQKSWHGSRNMTNILQAADVFYWQRLGNRSHFLRLIIYHMGVKVREPHHLIQLMFYLGLIKGIPKTYKFYDLEKKVFSFQQHYSVQELALVINALFRKKSKLQYYPLMQELLIKSIKGFPSLDNHVLVSVSKGFNCAPDELKPLIALFQKKLLERIDDFNIEAIIHALWMFASNHVVNEDFAQAVYERAMKKMSELRTKELSRLVVVYTEFVSPSRDLKKLANCIFAEFQDENKSIWFRKKLFIQGATLHRMLICELCPHDFLDEYLMMANKDGEIANEALGIDVHLEVFHPEYKKTRLSPDVRESTFKNRFEDSSQPFVKSHGKVGSRSSFNRKLTVSSKDVLLSVVGNKEDCILIKQLVPSFGYIDVLLCISNNGTYLPIPDKMKESKPWELTKIPPQNLKNGDKFVAITLVHSPEEYISKNISCLQREKTAILEKLGYIHFDMSIQHWRDIDVNSKKIELMNVIAETLSNQSKP